MGVAHEPAGWVCGERVISARLLRGGVEERDARADVEALVISMLSWACGDHDVPRHTVDRT